MKHKIYLLMIFIVGLINFLPVLGLFSVAELSQAYGIEFNSNELEVLMRHRALLFGILGGFVLYSLFKASLRAPALVMSGVSMIGFLLLGWIVGDVNDELMKITYVDVVGILCLVIAIVLQFVLNKRPQSY